MQPHEIAVRSHDTTQGLVTVSMGHIETYCRTTRIVGAAAQMASLLAEQSVLPYETLIACGAELQYGAELVDKVLDALQEIDYVRLVQRGNRRLVEVRALGLRDRYENLGIYWSNAQPTDLEELFLEVLNRLAIMPRYLHELKDELDLSPRTVEVIKAIGENAGVLDGYQSPTNGAEIWFSPLYWADNPESIFQLVSQYSTDHVIQALNKIKSHAGMPDTQVNSDVLRDAIQTGMLPTPAINSSGGEHKFVFLPPKGLKLEERSIAEKAMAFVACARYAENFAARPLSFPPVVLLRALREKLELRPHSETQRQWGPLASLQVVHIVSAGGSYHQVKLIDSPENIKALDHAIQLLSLGEAEYDDASLEDARKVIVPGSFHNATATRAKVRRTAEYGPTPTEVMHDILRGVSPDLA
jgi:hypothetical protein